MTSSSSARATPRDTAPARSSPRIVPQDVNARMSHPSESRETPTDSPETWAHLRHCRKEFVTACNDLAESVAAGGTRPARTAPQDRLCQLKIRSQDRRHPPRTHRAHMTSYLPPGRLCLLTAACLPLVLAACSVEHATNRCAADSTTLDGLIRCVREMHASARKCDVVERGPAAVPVAGRRVLKFGETTKHGGTSRGIVFEGARGAEVRAPVSGLVTYADAWRSYGDLLIIDSCTTVALMAGALTPEVIAGENTTAGHAIAKLRQTSSDAPVLYLEVRENETAVDPASVIPSD